MILRIALAAAMMTTPAAADDWQTLTGDRIKAALNARVLGYSDGASQNFFADGRTLYEGGNSAQWGQWRTEGNRYCSVWPPSDRWSCYSVETLGIDLRFVSDGGSVTTGRYIDLQ